jgi:hypothetical protein
MKGADGEWIPMQNKWGKAWEVSHAPALPWDFRFVSENGQAVEAKSLVGTSGQVGDLPTGVQFDVKSGDNRKLLAAGAADAGFEAEVTLNF